MTTEREIEKLLAEHYIQGHACSCGKKHNWLAVTIAYQHRAHLASVLAANTATAVNAAVEAAVVRVEALCEHPPALRGACFACFAAACVVRGDS